MKWWKSGFFWKFLSHGFSGQCKIPANVKCEQWKLFDELKRAHSQKPFFSSLGCRGWNCICGYGLVCWLLSFEVCLGHRLRSFLFYWLLYPLTWNHRKTDSSTFPIWPLFSAFRIFCFSAHYCSWFTTSHRDNGEKICVYIQTTYSINDFPHFGTETRRFTCQLPLNDKSPVTH